MALTRYTGVLEQADAGNFGVWFPDFPGCVSAGETMNEALANAYEALAFHIEGMIEDRQNIPAPTPMAEIAEQVLDRLYFLFPVTLDVPETADLVYVRLSITMPDNLVAAIDHDAAGNRSGWLALAAKEKLIRDGQVKALANVPELRSPRA